MKTDKVVIKGGRLLDPGAGVEGEQDLLLTEGKVEALDKPGAFAELEDAEEVNAQGLLVVPGLIDIHVHLREPGFEWKETIETGAQAAVAGGFTDVCCMPNTNPVNDSAQVTDFILEQAKAAGLARVHPIGAISQGSQGKALSPMLELKEAGCVAFSDDGLPVSNAGLMRKALEYSLMIDAVLTCHEEELSLSQGFSMNESALSLKMGLLGMPDAAENVMIARDIELARLTGAPVHFCHVSTMRGVELIRRAKEDGIPVTAEVSPHHFTIDESWVEDYNTAAKVSMPLRNSEDVQAMLEGLSEGVIDCIASDHAPHEADSKSKEFSKASFGLIGLQTTLPLTLAKVRSGGLSLERAIAALTSDAARCLKLSANSLTKGSQANLTLVDLERKITLEPEMIRSKSRNTPFLGQELQGVAVQTFVEGKRVFSVEQ